MGQTLLHALRPRADRPLTLAALLLLGLLLWVPQTFAHGISVWAEVLDDGETVGVEVYYSDGKPAAGVKIEVFAEDGPETEEGAADPAPAEAEPVATGETDTEGRFRFRPEGPGDLLVRAAAGGHHRAEARVKAGDFESL